MRFSPILLFLFISTVWADYPWGKDADLACPISPPIPKCPPKDKPLEGVSEALIRFHQEVISPADGPRSNYLPSSSQYAKEAIQKHGFFEGFGMGCDRLMRENDEAWVYPAIQNPEGNWMKYDPVP